MNGQIDRTPVYPLTQCLYCVYYVHSLYKSQRCNEAGNKLVNKAVEVYYHIPYFGIISVHHLNVIGSILCKEINQLFLQKNDVNR